MFMRNKTNQFINCFKLQKGLFKESVQKYEYKFKYKYNKITCKFCKYYIHLTYILNTTNVIYLNLFRAHKNLQSNNEITFKSDNSKRHLSSTATMITDKEKLQTQYERKLKQDQERSKKDLKLFNRKRSKKHAERYLQKAVTTRGRGLSSLPPLSFLARQIGKCRGERTKKGWKEINRKRDEQNQNEGGIVEKDDSTFYSWWELASRRPASPRFLRARSPSPCPSIFLSFSHPRVSRLPRCPHFSRFFLSISLTPHPLSLSPPLLFFAATKSTLFDETCVPSTLIRTIVSTLRSKSLETVRNFKQKYQIY